MSDTLVHFLEDRLNDYMAELTTLSGTDSYSHDKDDVNHVVDWLEQRLSSLHFEVTRFPQPTAGDNLRADRYGSGQGESAAGRSQ